jgi:cyclophilin family peptidyl-prolyl cis-trans isomerase
MMAVTASNTRLVLLVCVIGLAAGVVTPAQGTRPVAAAPGPVLVFETVKGTFEIETYPSQAPKAVAHIVGLVNKRFYNGLRVHRTEENFIVQFGDPQTRDYTLRDQWGNGGSGRPVGVAEISKVLKQTIGMVSLAHTGNASTVDSQMFVVLGPASHIEGKFPIVGRVTIGLDVVRKLAVEDRIIRATVKDTP